MKRCSHCGQENENLAAQCVQCGTDKFVVPEPRTETGAPAVDKGKTYTVRGRFRLREAGASFPSGHKTVATSLGGLKEGLLTISPEGLVLRQRLAGAAGLLLFILSLFPSTVLALMVTALLKSCHLLGRENEDMVTGLLVLGGAAGTPFFCAFWIRRFKRTFRRADITRCAVVDDNLEINLRSEAPPTTPAGTEPVAPDTRVVQLSFKPAERNDLTQMAELFSTSEAEVKDPLPQQMADFTRSLTAVTPRTWVTYALIASNVVMFLALLTNAGPAMKPWTVTLLGWGADFGPFTVSCGQWWRLLTNCFLHASMLHLVCNMYVLWQAGKLTERLFGNWFFLLIYLGCGLTASQTSLWFNPAVVSLGASGAIFGVYGALLGYLVRERGGLPRSLSAPVAKSAAVFIVFNLVYGVMNLMEHAAVNPANHQDGGVIDLAAHAGGLVAGLIFGFLGARSLVPAERRAAVPGRGLAVLAAIGLIMALLFIPVLKANPTDIARMKMLGEMFFRGEGVVKDPEAAANWFKQAGEQGDLSSQNLLGSMYLNGEGVAKNVDEALLWFGKAGEQGDLNAGKILAGIYLRGDGVPTNTIQGIKWLTKVADEGDVDAEKSLAAAYFKGELVDKDMTESVKWARKVGEQGDLKFQTMLAAMYFQGEGVDQDKAEAANWYRLAANQGDSDAQVMIGQMCAKGEGVAKDPVEALKWLILTSDSRPQITALRQTMESEVSADQKQQVDVAVAKFLKLQARRHGH